MPRAVLVVLALAGCLASTPPLRDEPDETMRIGLFPEAPEGGTRLVALHEGASVKPALVQNRTFTRPQADAAVRAFCREHGLGYEGFSLLTAIPQVLAHPALRAVAARTGRTPAEVVLAWCRAEGMIVLTGTTSREHMRQDLAVDGIDLLPEEGATLAQLV